MEEALVRILFNTMTQDSQLCHMPGKTRLQHSANGLPPGPGVPGCFSDFFRSLQLMGQQRDRGKTKIHSWAASAGEQAHGVAGRVLWEKAPGSLRGNGIWLLELKGMHFS